MSEEFEGLCNSDHWMRNSTPDHWKGYYTRGTPKGKIQVAWNHVSASQIENYQKCPRSWFFKSIQKVHEEQKGHQSLGEAFHLIMEKVPQGLGWPSHSDVNASPEDWEKAEAMAKQALPLLPRVDQTSLVDLTPLSSYEIKREYGLRMDTYEGGPTMVGYIDLGIPTGIGWPALLVPENEAIIADYKTLSDFRYMKTPQELASNVQMMTYAKWALGEDASYIKGLRGEDGKQPEYVRLVHLYARTKAPFTRASIRHETALVTAQEINSYWEKTLDTVREMSQVALCGDPDLVDAKGALNGHCEAYGGCAFRDKCGIAKQSGIKALFQISKKPSEEQPQIMSSILDKINAAKAKAASVGTQASTPTSTPAASSPVSATGVASSPATSIHTESTPVTSQASPVAETGSVSANQPVSGTGSAVSSSANQGTVGKPISGLMAKIAAKGQGKPTVGGDLAKALGNETGQPLVTLLGDGKLLHTTCNTLGELMKLAAGVVPPDAPTRAQPQITRPGDAVTDPNEGDTEDGGDGEDDGVGENLNGSLGVDPSLATTGAVVEPAKRRGRPSNAEIEARKQAEAAAFEARVQAEVNKRVADFAGDNTDPVVRAGEAEYQHQIRQLNDRITTQTQLLDALRDERDKAKASATPDSLAVQKLIEENKILRNQGSEGLTLYVDCFPTKGDREVQDFFEWIGPICAKVAQQNSVNDWRMINYTAKGLLASAIRETISTHGAPKSLTISTFSGGADIALEVLTSIAKRVIKKL